MATNTSGVGASGLDVNSIVSQLMSIERRPIGKLDAKEASYQAKLSAYGSLKGAIANFQTAVSGLSSADSFQSTLVTPSDANIFSASATSSAAVGTYSMEITSLAQAQTLVAAGQASDTATVGAGAATTVTFDFGTISGGSFANGTYTGATFTSNGSGVKSVTIDSSNNSLQGIRDAINNAGIGITASIINDGSGTPYRLALSSGNKGVSNSIKISVSGDASLSNLLAHNPASTQNLAETVTAQNAVFKVNGVSISKNSNSVSDVIKGVTLTLNKVTTAPATLTVSRNTGAISGSISAFVKAYNDLATTLKNSSAYDADSKKGAVLQGDSTVRTAQTQLRSILSTRVNGTSGALTRLSDVGITFQKNGTLALDQTKLDSAITASFIDIAGLFVSIGKGTDSLVNFSAATSDTKAGSYAVNITQIATQGKSTGSTAANTTIVTGSNDALDVSINGVSASIVLAAGTYTALTLAAELQSKINSVSALSSAGIAVNVTQSAGVMTITSSNYGSSSSVAVAGGNAATGLMGTPVETSGVDAAGSIGGVSATGSGQKLTASLGDALGLSITVNGGALGARGTLNYSIGYASLLDKWSASILASDGALAGRSDGIGKSIADIGKRRTELETRLINIEKGYRAQFTSLDALLSSMNQTSNYLTQQLAQLAKL